MTVGYTRISDDRDGTELGVTRQREDIEELARRLGWPEVTEIYEDNDLTADPRKAVRPDFQRLLADMRAGRVTHVVVYDQDRLVRDMRDLEDVVEASAAGDVLLTSVNGDIDLRTDNGRLVARILAAMGKSELERLSRRIKREQLQYAQSGRRRAAPVRTFGYTRNYELIPEEAAWVAEIFRRKAKGESAVSLARMMNEAGVPTAGKQGQWYSSTITKMVERHNYVGDISIKGEVIGRAVFEAIVDRDLFDRANAAVAAARQPANTLRRRGLLTPLLVCATCQGRMVSTSAAEKRYYRCAGRPGSCGSNSIGAIGADRAVLEAVRLKELRGQIVAGEVAPGATPMEMIERELAHALTRLDSGELEATDLVSIIRTMHERLARRRGPRDPDPSETAAKRLWITQYVARIVITKSVRPPQGNVAQPDRITLHFRDGEVRQLPRPVDVAEVARLAKCSLGTVHLVLGGSMRKRVSAARVAQVWAAVRETGYVPAS